MDYIIPKRYCEKINGYYPLHDKDIRIFIEYRNYSERDTIDTFFHWYKCVFYKSYNNVYSYASDMIILIDLVYNKIISIENFDSNRYSLDLDKIGLMQHLLINLIDYVKELKPVYDQDLDKFIEFGPCDFEFRREQHQIVGWKELLMYKNGIQSHQFHFVDWSDTLSNEEMQKIYFPDYKITRSQYGDISIFGKDMKGWIDY